MFSFSLKINRTLCYRAPCTEVARIVKKQDMFKLGFRAQSTQYFCYCTKATSKTSPYTHTVLLPKTKLPLRLEGNRLVTRDKNVHKVSGFEELYEWQKRHLTGPEYTLHDGPPYANGKPHMGHAINKVLKDIILRYKLLNKTRVNYVPGWDCHGLPIELKALSGSENLDTIEIRAKARNFAEKTIKQQMDTFQSWGIIGDWKNRYETKSVSYIENQLAQFLKLYEKGYIYRDFKPIHWSPSSRTALAEAELEYNEKHKSPSVYVRLLIKDLPEVPNLNDKRVYALIWTTTPWTLPSNQAVCYNNSLSYSLIKKPDLTDTDLYIVATDLYEAVCKETDCEYQLLGVHSGDMLQNATYIHPVYSDKACRFLHSSHATSTKGTGLVHTAPAHGPDDFLVGLENKMPVVDLVNEEGCYKKEAGDVFAGKFVLTEGNDVVLGLLQDNLMHRSVIEHSYPYDWRTKQPVIIKASKQWFIDTGKVKNRAVEILDSVKIIPQDKSDIYKTSLVTQLQKRPYWCISRQRKWGVPIPVFYNRNSKETLINRSTINHICNLLHKHGTDFWWKLPLEKLLPEEYSHNFAEYSKGEDILDIWFDSGISWSYVLKNDQIADLYLEGVDQFTGWFQASLLTSVALRDQAPYKAVFVHGFAVDQNGVKMSKSLGNVVDPQDVIGGKGGQKVYGVDALRWWVACHANQVSLASIGDNILEQSKEEVQKVRGALRFCVAAIFDYQYDEKDFENCTLVDRYMLHLMYQFFRKSKEHIDAYNFHRINTTLLPLVANQISALYFTSIKDRLYCDPVDSSSRRSAQYTLLHLYYTLSQVVGGILPHLVEECYAHLPQKNGETFFTSDLSEPNKNWEDGDVEDVMNLVLELKKEVNKTNGEGSTLNKNVLISLGEEEFRVLKPFICKRQFQDELKDIFQVSEVQFLQDCIKDSKLKVNISKSDRYSCPRCRLVQSNLENELCGRCQSVVNNLDLNKKAVAG